MAESSGEPGGVLQRRGGGRLRRAPRGVHLSLWRVRRGVRVPSLPQQLLRLAAGRCGPARNQREARHLRRLRGGVPVQQRVRTVVGEGGRGGARDVNISGPLHIGLARLVSWEWTPPRVVRRGALRRWDPY